MTNLSTEYMKRGEMAVQMTFDTYNFCIWLEFEVENKWNVNDSSKFIVQFSSQNNLYIKATNQSSV